MATSSSGALAISTPEPSAVGPDTAGAVPPPTRFGVSDMLRQRNRVFRDGQVSGP
jgi:hypothetical protein